MKLYLQFGWGMMDLSRELVRAGVSDTVILSPRDLEPQQLENISADIHKIGGSVLVDPQFYLPRADHHRLISHDYWPDDYDTSDFSEVRRRHMMESLLHLNHAIGASSFIVPGERASAISVEWGASQSEFLSVAQSIADLPIIMTVCLSAEVIRSSEQVAVLMDYLEEHSSPTYYLVFEHPGNTYLVDDPQWLANTLDIVAALKLAGSNVIVGYSNHQQLIMASAAADAVASGTWMNVRSFFPDKFRTIYEEEVKHRSTWYYLPQALSEYTLPYLDIGFRQGLARELAPNPATQFSDLLFAVQQPSASGWGEPDAFRHYLSALSLQVSMATAHTFEETISNHLSILDTAETILNNLRNSGVRGRPREFQDALDANRAAIAILRRDHGPRLRRAWTTITH